VNTNCLAIIIDEEVSFIGTQGKKKNIECNLEMVRVDRFTYQCPKGHIRKTEQFEYKGFFDFISPRIIEALYK
jgi:hypothetical protein